MIFNRLTSLKGTVEVPGDKSISHRAIMLGSLANGTTHITNFLNGADCLSTIECFKKTWETVAQLQD
jgi:3-phosphoshikimate 1-carboxyvinyltransferase